MGRYTYLKFLGGPSPSPLSLRPWLLAVTVTVLNAHSWSVLGTIFDPRIVARNLY